MNAASPAQPPAGAQANPYSKLIRVDMLEKLPIAPDKKAQHVQIVSKHWETIRTTARESPEHRNAMVELAKYTTQLQQHLARTKQAQQAQQAQQQQQQALQAGNRPAAATNPQQPASTTTMQQQQQQQQQAAAQSINNQPPMNLTLPPNAQRNLSNATQQAASNNATQPTSQNQTQPPVQQTQTQPQSAANRTGPSPAIHQHLSTFIWTYPAEFPEGTPQGKQWLSNAQNKYVTMLNAMELAVKQLQPIVEQEKEFNSQGIAITPEFTAKKNAARERYIAAKRSVDQFRAQHGRIPDNKDGPQGASATAMPAARPPGAQNQTQPVNPAVDAARNAAAARSSSSPVSATHPPSAMAQPPTSATGQMQRPNAPARPVLNTHQPGAAGATAPQSATQPVPLTHVAAIDRSHSERSQAPGSQQTPAPNPAHYAPRTQSETQVHKNYPISKQLPPSTMQPPTPVSGGPPRPTMANGGSSVQPIIAKQPTFTLEGDAKSHVLNKKKLDELVRQVTGSTTALTPHAEELVIEMADEFVDNVVTAACKLAKLRSDSTLQIRDLQTVLERSYNIRIPGYSIDETRVVRRVNPAPSWNQKMNAINAAKVMNNTKTDN